LIETAGHAQNILKHGSMTSENFSKISSGISIH